MAISLDFNPPVIAHRGASAYAPENTLSAFIKAAQLGIKWVEFDVMSAACGEPIIFHDETLDRTTNGHGFVGHYTYTELRALDAGGWFAPEFSCERIPLLLDILLFLKEMHLSANIEIKPLAGANESTVVQALTLIETIFPQPHPDILLSSFSIEALHSLRRLSPHCLLGLLLDKWDKGWEKNCIALNCVSVNVNEAILTEEKALKIKAMGKRLLCYTVNDPLRAAELFSWGVDAVFSDIPDKILLLSP